jgi:hypothetical protein
MERTSPVKIPKVVWQGIEAVRLSGKTNMLDVQMVQRLAFEMEYFATVLWMRDHRELYCRGLFEGFEIEGGE